MVNIIKEELPIEESLKKKLELICEFSKVAPTIINDNIRKSTIQFIFSKYLNTLIQSITHKGSKLSDENFSNTNRRFFDLLIVTA